MKKYNPKEYLALKAQVEWNEKYGENTGAVARTQPVVNSPQKHSFSHLTNVHYEVQQHRFAQFSDYKGNPYALPYDKEGQYHKAQKQPSSRV